MLNSSGPSKQPTRDGNSSAFRCWGMAVQTKAIRVPLAFHSSKPLSLNRSVQQASTFKPLTDQLLAQGFEYRHHQMSFICLDKNLAAGIAISKVGQQCDVKTITSLLRSLTLSLQGCQAQLAGIQNQSMQYFQACHICSVANVGGKVVVGCLDDVNIQLTTCALCR